MAPTCAVHISAWWISWNRQLHGTLDISYMEYLFWKLKILIGRVARSDTSKSVPPPLLFSVEKSIFVGGGQSIASSLMSIVHGHWCHPCFAHFGFCGHSPAFPPFPPSIFLANLKRGLGQKLRKLHRHRSIPCCLSLKGKLGDFFYRLKVVIGPKLSQKEKKEKREVSIGNFHRKAPK